MNANLLIKKASVRSLDAFVADLSQTIGLTIWDERQSSNYFGDRYFQSEGLGIELTAALADDSEFRDFRFWLSLQPEIGCRSEMDFLNGLTDCVARKLAQRDYEIVRPFDIGRAGSGGLIYRRNSEPGAKPRERVITEEI